MKKALKAAYVSLMHSPPAVFWNATRLRSLARQRQPVCLHFGCGPRHFEGWINIDFFPQTPMPDVLLDATREIPLPGDSVKYIFCESMIEVIGNEGTRNFLSECYRVLSPNGVLRLLTLDLSSFLRSYFDRSERDLDFYRKTFGSRSFAEMVQTGIKGFGHQFIFDVETMTELLTEIGFECRQNGFGESSEAAFAAMELRNSADGPHSMYFDCIKPAINV